MITTITTKNMITIPSKIAQQTGIKPGWKLDWEMGQNKEELIVRIIPDRAELARRLKGAGKKRSGSGPAVDALVRERADEEKEESEESAERDENQKKEENAT